MEIKKHDFLIPFGYQMYGRIPVCAETEEEALILAENWLDNVSVEDMAAYADYLMSSEEVDYEGVITRDGNTI